MSGPAVSIIMPTYNRERFLPQAFESIRRQRFADWELIVVDDGSTDDTADFAATLTQRFTQPVRYIQQRNQGPYGARNTGLDHAQGRYIAFYDSDDEWLPHHLENCVDALERNSDVDWVYHACRVVDDATGKVTSDSTFRRAGRARPFLSLPVDKRGKLNVIAEPNLATCILNGAGLFAGLQNSVIRRELFAQFRFEADLRNEAEDQILVILAAVAGKRFGYIDDVGVVYRVHAENSSAAASGQSLERRLRVYEAVAAGFERLPNRVRLSKRELGALDKLIGNEYFWHLGYGTLWQMGNREECFRAFHKALRLRPFHLPFWKTYLACRLRSWLSPRGEKPLHKKFEPAGR